jgi:hypothetical protein
MGWLVQNCCVGDPQWDDMYKGVRESMMAWTGDPQWDDTYKGVRESTMAWTTHQMMFVVDNGF